MSVVEADSNLIKDEIKFPSLQRYFPSMKFMNSIPSKAQRGFKDIGINFTCLDVCEEYFAIGTNVGIVYLYNRKKEHLYKLRNKEYTNPITCVKLLISLECMVAVGTKNGHVFAFKVPFKQTEEIEKFKVDGLHEATITSLEWAKNGMKFFSGDLTGTVVCTEIDHFEHESRSSVLLEENSTIVQLSYANLILLISTYQRSFLYDTQKGSSLQVGQKERKCSGRFGATIYDDRKDSPYVYASRPGQRIWKSDYSGIISETIILKAGFFKSDEKLPNKDFQFGPLKVYNDHFLLTYSSEKVVLIDPKKKAIQCVWDSNDIVDVATTHQEIIILQGVRHVTRFALHSEEEESYIQKDVTCRDDEMQCENTSVAALVLENKVQSQDVVHEVEVPNVLDWIKRKFSDVSLPTHEKASSVLKTGRSHTVAEVSLPDVIEFDQDIPKIQVKDNIQLVAEEAQFVAEEANKKGDTVDSAIGIDDDIVYKPKKKKKKKKKKVVTEEESGNPVHLIKAQEESLSLNENSGAENVDANGESIDTLKSEEEIPKSINNAKLSEDTTDCKCDSFTPEVQEYSLLSHESKEGGEENADELCEVLISTTLKCTSEKVNNNEEANSDEDPLMSVDIYSSKNHVPVFDEAKSMNSSTVEHKTEEQLPNPKQNSSELGNDNDYPKYGIECVQYTAPGPLTSLSASNHHLFCIDNQNKVYISGFSYFGFKWLKLSQPGEQIAVSPSEHIIWILYQQTVYVAMRSECVEWYCEWWKSKSTKWVPIAKSISYISVDDTSSWYISSSGHLFTNQHLSFSRPYSYPERVPCPNDVVKVACKDDNVWLLTADDKLYCRICSYDGVKMEKEWELVMLPPSLSVDMVAFGSKKEAYMLGSNGTLWFRLGVSSLTPHGVNSTMEVESSHYIYESQGQIRKVVSKVINSEILSNILYKQRHGIIAASSAGIWWCKSLDTILYSYEKCIIGHSWDSVIPKGTLASTQWAMISAEGYCSSQGILWGADAVGELICFSLKSINSIAVNLPISVSLKHVHYTPYGMWILSTDGDIFIRREMSDRCPQGVWWHQLDTSQMSGVNFSHISCSSEAVWACDTDGNMYVRIGTLNPPAGRILAQVWIEVDAGNTFPKLLAQKVYVGPKSYMVWAIDNQGCVYARSGITQKFPLGNQWIFVPSPRVKQLCISGNAVWLLKDSGKIFRRFGVTKSNITGDYWKQIPGNLSYISVTEEDDLWGVQEGSLFSHNSCTLKYESRVESTVNLEDVSEDDWEDISAHISDKDC